MRPAASIILFTTMAGAAQGAAVTLAVATLAGRAPVAAMPLLLGAVAAMLFAALAASFFHLGHPLRAWRAVMMWRTSWMSREVITLPVFIAVIVAWAIASAAGPDAARTSEVLAVLAIVGAFVLWYFTAMIYACIRFIQEWAHPLTIVNYVTLGLSSGLVTSAALAVSGGQAAFARALAPWILVSLALAWFTRSLSLRRNDRLVPVSSLQSATGVRASRLVQRSMGMTGGSFNTREFFHRAAPSVVRGTRLGFQVLGFAVPILFAAWATVSGAASAWLATAACHAMGLLMERWYFFAQARHPQNLYYQHVS